MESNIETLVMITIKHLQIYQVSAINNPLGVDIRLKKYNSIYSIYLSIYLSISVRSSVRSSARDKLAVIPGTFNNRVSKIT